MGAIARPESICEGSAHLTWTHSYLQVSNVSAAALRRCLKPDAKIQALKREEQMLKVARWSNGKAGEVKLLYKDQA
ncbi:hypothetical protein BC830DRAFT_1098329 [Chytriomyces sp. MP71]|nr:hypothetical protein BC830DRAFT_1098329 [Chytriomyces sp. MP71]